jgi:hypothetical protein
MAGVNRQTVDLSEYPDLVVIYLGMQVYSLRGLRALARLGRQIRTVVKAKPDGLLAHEDFAFAQFPLQVSLARDATAASAVAAALSRYLYQGPEEGRGLAAAGAQRGSQPAHRSTGQRPAPSSRNRASAWPASVT